MPNAHVIGICGTGMSAVAMLLRDKGYAVTGSDSGFYPPASDYLASRGIPFATSYSPRNIPADVDLFMVGKNAKLDPKDNAEVAAAYASGKPVLSYPEVLADIVRGREVAVVTGSFGKSSCTAL